VSAAQSAFGIARRIADAEDGHADGLKPHESGGFS